MSVLGKKVEDDYDSVNGYRFGLLRLSSFSSREDFN